MLANAAEMQARRQPKARLIGVRHLDGRTRSAMRARKLVKTFAAEIGGTISSTVGIAIERAATLVVLAEDCRARRLAGDLTIALDDLVRCTALRRPQCVRSASQPVVALPVLTFCRV